MAPRSCNVLDVVNEPLAKYKQTEEAVRPAIQNCQKETGGGGGEKGSCHSAFARNTF